MIADNFSEGTLTLKGEEIPVKHCLIPQADLLFYQDNPRIYSIVYSGDEELTQNEIEERLIELDHVKQLIQSIQANGGLLDPLIVKEGVNVVLEGNSRLAAYRVLSRKDAIKWGNVKCILLPEDISEEHVFALLGEYHIIGRKDWAPYEQAGYLFRRFKKHNITPEKMSKEMGISIKQINHFIEVYTFMIKYNENSPQRWSYYDEYLKSLKIRKAREYLPELDETVVEKVKKGEISKAIEIRDKVAKICAVKGNTLKKFAKNKVSLEKCYDQAVAGGIENVLVNKLDTFRKYICDSDIKRELKKMPVIQQKKCEYNLEKIKKSVQELLKLYA